MGWLLALDKSTIRVQLCSLEVRLEAVTVNGLKMRCETNLSDVFYTQTFISVNVFIFSMQRRKANKKSWLCLLTECVM